MKHSDRAAALEILLQLFQHQTPLTHLLQKPGLSPLTKTLCFGVARHATRLELLAEALVEKRPKDLTIWLCILLGLYQIDALSIPDYAVVQETVALLQQKRKSWAKGFVNALLRRFCREHAALTTSLMANPLFAANHPKWFLKTIQNHWPKDWQAILTANDQHPPMTLRVNQQRMTRAAYSTRLTEMNIEHTCLDHSMMGVILHDPRPVQDIPGFVEGDVSVQDGAAQLAVTLLDLKPGLRVLDACCAPGGKIGHILEQTPQLASCLGIDIEDRRLQSVQENCDRLQLHPTLRKGDATQPSTWWDGVPFDRILLDAPCSATGIIRRHPDIKHLRSPEDIAAITMVQANLLDALWPLLAPGGLLVYATCSIMPEENELQIARFLTKHSDACAAMHPQPWARCTGHGWQILPGENQMDGFFYAILRHG